ncbi:hypothetical protein DFJ74DRAFT_691936 [Hyaloraphidium curvatum]|nr:hypothetical protein DFJ74DRAFT_691936 [Hyaloraphidium curvatum]
MAMRTMKMRRRRRRRSRTRTRCRRGGGRPRWCGASRSARPLRGRTRSPWLRCARRGCRRRAGRSYGPRAGVCRGGREGGCALTGPWWCLGSLREAQWGEEGRRDGLLYRGGCWVMGVLRRRRGLLVGKRKRGQRFRYRFSFRQPRPSTRLQDSTLHRFPVPHRRPLVREHPLPPSQPLYRPPPPRPAKQRQEARRHRIAAYPHRQHARLRQAPVEVRVVVLGVGPVVLVRGARAVRVVLPLAVAVQVALGRPHALGPLQPGVLVLAPGLEHLDGVGEAHVLHRGRRGGGGPARAGDGRGQGGRQRGWQREGPEGGCGGGWFCGRRGEARGGGGGAVVGGPRQPPAGEAEAGRVRGGRALGAVRNVLRWRGRRQEVRPLRAAVDQRRRRRLVVPRRARGDQPLHEARVAPAVREVAVRPSARHALVGPHRGGARGVF